MRSGSRSAAASTLLVITPGGVPRAAAAIYGAGLCALFGGARLYHRWRWHPRWRPILRRIDHSTIFVFIAACYTPVGLLVLVGHDALGRAGHRLGGALGGVALSVAWITRAARRCAPRCYVALGWVAVLAFPQMSAALPVAPLVLMAAGGVLYTAGAVDLRARAPEPVAAGVRLPRDLPRVRDPRRGGALRRHGRLDRLGLSPSGRRSLSCPRRHRRPAPASRRAAARAHRRGRRGVRPQLRRGFVARAGRAGDGRRPASRSRSRRASPGSSCRAPASRTGTASRA